MTSSCLFSAASITFDLVDFPVSVLIGVSFSLLLSGLRFSEDPQMKHCSLMLKLLVSSLVSLLGWDEEALGAGDSDFSV